MNKFRQLCVVLFALVSGVSFFGARSTFATEIDDPFGDQEVELTDQQIQLFLHAERSPRQVLADGMNSALRTLGDAIQQSYLKKHVQFIPEVHFQLRNAMFLLPQNGRDFRPCHERPGTLAFVLPTQNDRVYICANTFLLDETRRPIVFGQILIHEAVHLTGVHDECDTTLWENEIMYLAHQPAFKNGYVDGCFPSGIPKTLRKDEIIIANAGSDWRERE